VAHLLLHGRVDKVQRAFGTLTCSNPLGALVKLRRTGTVEEYKVQFLPMLARCWPLQEHDQIDIFTAASAIRCRRMSSSNTLLPSTTPWAFAGLRAPLGPG
jgi:hypothetical protein